MIAIEDKYLRGLSRLAAADLQRITGAEDPRPIRFRYRAGKRAILHVATGAAPDDQGVLWFFRGDKAQRLARRNKTACFDAETGALFEVFPNDHRMPQIRAFLENYFERAPVLFGKTPLGPPELLRYRPGLSSTFRSWVVGGTAIYTKLINDDDVARLFQMNREIVEKTASGPLHVARALGIDTEFGAIAYEKARGVALDAEIRRCDSASPILQGLDALRRLSRLDLAPKRTLDRDALLHRAHESAQLVIVAAPELKPRMAHVLQRLSSAHPAIECRPIHADMKLEHMFLDGGRTTLIDTESLSLGPPDYDLAQLFGRLWQAEFEGELSSQLAGDAAEEVLLSAGPSFRWCLDVVAIRLAKFYAQRPGQEITERINAMLDRLEWSFA